MPSYYDIDAILAEEELIPCTTLLDFSHLAHLDPDYDCNRTRPRSSKALHADEENRNQTDGSNDALRKPRNRNSSYLSEGSRIKIPLWAVDKWAVLGYVRIGIPRHFGRKARERIQADPSSMDLRSKNERFFMVGMLVINLIERCSNVVAASSKRNNNNSRRNAAHSLAMSELLQEATELRSTLLSTFTGERLRRTFDWTLSAIDDDVSSYTKRLTEMETRLFQKGASAATAYTAWKNYGSRRIAVSETALRASQIQSRANIAKMVTPDQKGQEGKTSDIGGRKRRRVQ